MMIEQDDPELTSSHGHTGATTTSIASDSENNLKTGRTDLPQRDREKQATSKVGEGQRCGQEPNPGVTNHKCKSHCKHRGEIISDSTQCAFGPRNLHWEDKSL